METRLTLIELQPREEALRKAVMTTKDIDITTPLEEIKNKRLDLRRLQIDVETDGKRLREDAVKFQREIIARAKELSAIVQPEIDRLEAIESELASIARRALLPSRRKILEQFRTEIADEQLCALDEKGFTALVQIEQNKEFARLQLEEQKRQMVAYEENVRAKALKDAERVAEQKIADAKKAMEERILRDAEMTERIRLAKIAEENKRKNENNFKDFLKLNGFSEDTDKIIGNSIYRLVAVYNG